MSINLGFNYEITTSVNELLVCNDYPTKKRKFVCNLNLIETQENVNRVTLFSKHVPMLCRSNFALLFYFARFRKCWKRFRVYRHFVWWCWIFQIKNRCGSCIFSALFRHLLRVLFQFLLFDRVFDFRDFVHFRWFHDRLSSDCKDIIIRQYFLLQQFILEDFIDVDVNALHEQKKQLNLFLLSNLLNAIIDDEISRNFTRYNLLEFVIVFDQYVNKKNCLIREKITLIDNSVFVVIDWDKFNEN